MDMSKPLEVEYEDKWFNWKGYLAYHVYLGRNQLKNKNITPSPLKVNTKKIYQNQFTFPQVAQNDYVSEQLSDLEAAQQNFNQNPENETLMNKFIEVAQDTTDNLLKKYPGIWVDPSIDFRKQRRTEQLALLEKWEINF